MNNTLKKRLELVEANIRAVNSSGEYVVKIYNSNVEIHKIICPGNIKREYKEYSSPFAAIKAVEEYILKRRIIQQPICRFDNIIDIYPEASEVFKDYCPIQDLLSPYYGEIKSVYKYELRHILIYHHAAACVYGSDHNAYAVGKHPDAEWFEKIMDMEPVESQIALLNVILNYEIKKQNNIET